MTDEELRRLLSEATPGPWEVDPMGHRGVMAPVDNGIPVLSTFGRDAEALANGRLAAAAPDLAAEVLRLREALAVIADPERLASHGDPAVLRDYARAALNPEAE